MIVVDTATFDRIDSNHAGFPNKIDHHIPVMTRTINYVPRFAGDLRDYS